MKLVAALYNADTKFGLLSLVKDETAKVLRGIDILAKESGADEKVLCLPECATEIAEAVKAEAEAAGVTVVCEFVNVRANKENRLVHITEAIDAADKADGTYADGKYACVNGTAPKKYEASMTIKSVLEAAGADLSDVKAIEIGCAFYTDAALEQKVSEFEILNGEINVITSKQCLVAETEARTLAARKQSCGKCVFCREGLLQLQAMLADMKAGKGKIEYVDFVKEIGSAMTFSTPCTLGQNSSKAALSVAESFAKEYDNHTKKKECPVCFSKTVLYVDPQACTGCEECADVCPEDCIEGKSGFIHMIDEFDCTLCKKCVEACEEDAIIETSGKLPKLPDRLTKVGRFKKH